MTKSASDFQERLKRIFFEEAQDLINNLDQHLIILDRESDQNKIATVIDEIFNIVHSLKASTGSVGFIKLSQFLHSLESFLVDIRKRRIAISQEVVTILFDTSYLVKDGINFVTGTDSDIDDEEYIKVADLMKNIPKETGTGTGTGTSDSRTLLSIVPTPTEIPSSEMPSTEMPSTEMPPLKVQDTEELKKSTTDNNNNKGPKHWQIIMILTSDLLKSGTDPLMYFNEMSEFGELVNVSCNIEAVPSLEKFIFDELYLSWEIILKSNRPLTDIQNIFLFIEDKSEIKINDVSSRYNDTGVEKLLADKRLGDILIERGNINAEDVEIVAKKQERLGEMLVKENVAVKEEVEKAVDDQMASKKHASTTIRVDITKLDELVNLIGELVITSSQLKNLIQKVDSKDLRRALLSKCEESARITSNLQDRVMNARMVPIDTIFSQFYRIVRDISMKQEKNIRLVITGQETELDKNIVEKINNPLKHLVRNCADHGIEKPSVREENGKNREAMVHLKAYHLEGNIFIEVSDDGKGMDKDAIYKKAIELGLIKKDEHIDDDSLYELIFMPGFSTAKEITDISGRGVGMDIVKKAITDLHGEIKIFTQKNKGTRFVIRLPLTLAIIEGLLFRVGKQILALPLISVDEIFKPKKEQINTLEERGEFVNVSGKVCSLIRIHHLLDIEGAITDPLEAKILNVLVNGKKYSLLVDDIIGQQQVVLKSLEQNYEKVNGVSGTTILGNGDVGIIIDPTEVVSMFREKELFVRI
ncbi:MAG: chemotaxis protein CheA [Oligoflexia bacterium]|nr:chemotaxis protein CheA [Oligoflexia bacterium]